MPRGKTSVHLRLDSDIVDWFKTHGKGRLTRMNAVLRAYVDAHRRTPQFASINQDSCSRSFLAQP